MPVEQEQRGPDPPILTLMEAPPASSVELSNHGEQDHRSSSGNLVSPEAATTEDTEVGAPWFKRSSQSSSESLFYARALCTR